MCTFVLNYREGFDICIIIKTKTKLFENFTGIVKAMYFTTRGSAKRM